MKISFVISSLQSGGAEKVLSKLANHLCPKYKVSIISLAQKASPFYSLLPEISLINLNLLEKTTSPIKKLWNFLKRINKLRQTIKLESPDLIISFVDITNVTTLAAAISLKIPVIVSERTNPFHYKIPFFYELLRKILYPKALKVVVQTDSAAQYFSQHKNIFIIPNAVEALPRKQTSETKIRNIISLGRLDEGKDFQTLIKAFSLIYEENPSLILTIFGEGPERHNLETRIKQLNLEDRVFLPGAIKNIHEKLINCDLFVFPSRYEGFPNALCEAMTVGLPVIVSNCSGNIDVVEDAVNGRIFNIGNDGELAQIITELADDFEQRKSLSLEALKIVEIYQPSKIYKMWEDIIEKAFRTKI